ncbi:putative OSBP(Oxysterol binding protein)-related protein 4B [Quillaja saponaria]|uniref:OSBP(Oxysterol binding protein)-related protein 4B n=1 Tax=Quillaja saponaria TaxID=32244 RepID=A0AAD7QDR6_QUISA|nr:putative OSBP(Oxysterol binding protein)-related protein 4B [Quillaja saponaria]
MDCEHQRDMFLTKILSRNSSVSCSSHIYYYRNPEGVPFKWEMKPGTPINPPKEEALPPLCPPPAILSLGLPKPCIEQHKPSSRPRLIRFWKKKCSTRNKQMSKKLQEESHHQQECPIDHNVGGLDTFGGFEFCSSDCEFSASSRHSISSSSSSSFSFTNGPSVRSPSAESLGRDMYKRPLSCSPWNISRILVSVTRRV